jgi:hypothetical protein
MTYLGEEKPSLEELAHFGVKGMKWGVRNVERAAGYTDSQRDADAKKYGKRAPGRVDKRVAKGKTLADARAYNQNYRRNKRLMITGAYMAAKLGPIVLAGVGAGLNAAATNYVTSKHEAAGARAAANMFADSRGISSQPVINLSFNPATGVFG